MIRDYSIIDNNSNCDFQSLLYDITNVSPAVEKRDQKMCIDSLLWIIGFNFNPL